jgi:predicted metal-dependent HD superfamily phosphohydrolase
MLESSPKFPPKLQARFERAARAAGAIRPCETVFRDLVARYAEPHRHYHTLAHIDACLTWLDWFSGSAEHPEEVELALWFHDAIYVLGADQNERKSAELARAQLGTVGISDSSINRLAAYIEATASHVGPCGDSALVVDLDLTILGAPPREFEIFEAQIRREYAHVAEPVYRQARCHVLQGFLSRSQIYKVPPIRAELEVSARANLERRISELLLDRRAD